MALKLFLINILTLIRIIGAILLIPMYKHFSGFAVSILVLLCYITDSLDGLLARKWKASTFLGALFDSVADKLFTIMSFIVLYMITPYALIPIIFELLIILVQFLKFKKRLNIKSNIIGKCKVWILAMCVVLTFLLSDINSIPYLSTSIKNYLLNIENSKLYFYVILPSIIMEILTLLSYLVEVFIPNKIKIVSNTNKEIEMPTKSKNILMNFKNIWLNPEFYNEHKNDSNLIRLINIK